MPDAGKSADQITRGHEETTLEGARFSFDDADHATRREALERAFDYRGDVTLSLADGTSVTGYIFDRRQGDTLAASRVRLMTADADQPVAVGYDTIAGVSFTGRDAAHGKSWETWVRKYVERKQAELGNEPRS